MISLKTQKFFFYNFSSVFLILFKAKKKEKKKTKTILKIIVN